jgi:hypothetical protein
MVCGIAAAIALNAGDAERQLEAAIHREIVLGDLAGSMEQYRTLMATGDPQVAARAAFHIAQCQEKLGQRKEAYNTYRRIVADFGDQSGVAAQARAKLAAWSGPRNLKFDEGVAGRVPPGWFVPSFPKDADYLAELRRDGCRSKAGCAVVLVPNNVPNPKGNLMQNFSAASYAGKTVRLRAWLRVDSFFQANVGYRLPNLPNLEDRAQLWMKVERANHKTGFSDSMDDRPVRSADWTRAEIVGQIDEDAQFISFGVESTGGGRVWIDDVSFEVIPPQR